MHGPSRLATLSLGALLFLPSCTTSQPVVNAVCGRYAKIVISDASAVHLTDAELLEITDHNDKLKHDCEGLK